MQDYLPWLASGEGPTEGVQGDLSRYLPPEGDREACLAMLQNSSVVWKEAGKAYNKSGCGYEDGVRVLHSGVEFSRSFVTSCRTAYALAVWEHQVLQPAARKHLKQEVSRITHLGSYACRAVRGGGRLSEHAKARAIDIRSFTLKDGSRVGLPGDWRGETAEARFMQEIHAGACRIFSGVIGPDGNRDHHGHFHFDLGTRDYCK